jgi:hypothetical protein
MDTLNSQEKKMIKTNYKTLVVGGSFSTHLELIQYRADVHQTIMEVVDKYGIPHELIDDTPVKICDTFLDIAGDFVGTPSAFIVMIDYPKKIEHKLSKEDLNRLSQEDYKKRIELIGEYVRNTCQISIHFRELKSPMLELYQIGEAAAAAQITFMEKQLKHDPLAVEIDSDKEAAGFIYGTSLN